MTAPDEPPLLHVAEVVKHYQALRPLRVRDLRVRHGQSLSLFGFDKAAAEILVNVVTGASLPDAGTVRVLGKATADITDSTEWMEGLRRFGLFSDRTVLVEPLTVAQNLALPHTLAVDPMPDDIARRVRGVAEELGVESLLDRTLDGLSASVLARVRLGRALALDPVLLLAEHPSATLEGAEREAFGRTVRAMVERRRTAAIYMTADQDFARSVGGDVLTLRPATGELAPTSGWRRWFS